jgi:basic membrane lipoprotein Med (substrate-binding protein (PBP1-ABC) superfamily)
MKAFMKSTLAALMICALASIAVFAAAKDKVKTETVTFTEDVMVNGTLVKAGDYQIRFNEQSGELAVLKDGKVKAKTTAQLQSRSNKARSTAVRTLAKDGVAELIGVSFGGSNQDVVVGASSGAVTGNN